MPTTPIPVLRRRHFLQAGAACAATILTPRNPASAEGLADTPGGLSTRLLPGPAAVHMVGEGAPATDVWSYNGVQPGPVLRLRQGAPFRATVENGLPEATTVHWHGIRLPNAMDGVPGLTQPTIPPGGGRFDYAFTPPDAGTFWCHSHDNSLVQMGRCLAGALVVEEAAPPAVDRDLLWTIQDWRLRPDAQIAPGFANRMEAAMDGRVGNTVTINGRLPETLHVGAGERIRLRLLNAAISRIVALRFEGHRPVVVALNGQPCEPHEPADGRILLGPAMRADVMVDMQGEPGGSHEVVDDFYDGLSYSLTRLSYDPAPPVRPHPSDAALRLPPNPTLKPDLDSAVVHEVRMQGGMMGGMGNGGMMGMGFGAAWAINGQSMTGDGGGDMPPLCQVERGRSCILEFHNETAWWHPMHLHGHSFNVLSRDGAARPVGRHGAGPPARAGAGRLRRRQPRRLDAALPDHAAPGRRPHDGA